jgi:LacI family transcriptional regulator
VRTIREVAQRAGVSVGTVSNVLTGAVPVSERLRQRVLQVIQELDYQPNHLARSLKVKQTQMIGMVIRNVADPVFPEMLRGAEDAAWLQNYLLVLLNSDEQVDREQQILRALHTRRVDGILLTANPGSDSSHIRAVRDAGIPVVALEDDAPGLELDCVTADHAGGAKDCVRYLAECGHRSIGWVHSDSADSAEARRFEGYRDGLRDANLEFDDTKVARAESAGDLLARNPRLTAVMLADPLAAPQIGRTADLAVATFDHPRFCSALELVSVVQPSYDMGFKAMELLIQRIHDPARPRATVMLPCGLQIPQATEAARSAE